MCYIVLAAFLKCKKAFMDVSNIIIVIYCLREEIMFNSSSFINGGANMANFIVKI